MTRLHQCAAKKKHDAHPFFAFDVDIAESKGKMAKPSALHAFLLILNRFAKDSKISFLPKGVPDMIGHYLSCAKCCGKYYFIWGKKGKVTFFSYSFRNAVDYNQE